jgi:uncharacterized protein (TIGR03067 family)
MNRTFYSMKRICFLTMLLAASWPAFAADPDEDAKAMQGTWLPAKAELGGQPLPEAFLKTITLKLDNGNYEASVAGKVDKGTYTLDAASKPKGMSVTGSEGPNAGKTIPAIYEFEGERLRICYDLSGEKRPTEFKTAPGTQLYLVTYNRVKE